MDGRNRAGSSFAGNGVGVDGVVSNLRNHIHHYLVDGLGAALDNRIVQDSIDLVLLVIEPAVRNPAQADTEQSVAGQIQVILHA